MTRLELESLSFSYGEKKVFEDVNLVFDRPGLYCIIGPNGVGKSTLVKCIDRLLEPEGRVLIDGEDASDMKQSEIAERIAFVPSSSKQVFPMQVVDAIMMGRPRHGSEASDGKDLEMAYRAMKLLHMRDLAFSHTNELSAGQFQKMLIARGLVQQTSILILDEPTSNLDLKHQIFVTELLRCMAVADGIIILMISHDINIAAKYAHEIVMMAHPGVVKCRGRPEDVITSENLRDLYGLDCDVVEMNGHPYVVPGHAIMEVDDDLGSSVERYRCGGFTFGFIRRIK